MYPQSRIEPSDRLALAELLSSRQAPPSGGLVPQPMPDLLQQFQILRAKYGSPLPCFP